MKVSSRAVSRERDRLLDEVVALEKGKDEAKVAILEAKTNQECKYEYIDHLAFLLKPHLGLLPTDIVEQIHHIPEDIRVDVTPTDRRAPKAINTKVGKVVLSAIEP